VDEVLVDPGQLLAEDLVQEIDDPRIALHDEIPPALLGRW
jgi:hypothetical protein